MPSEDAFYSHFKLQKRENALYARWYCKRGLSPVWLAILDALYHSTEGLEPSQMAAELLIPRQTMTGLLDQLERRGYVRRNRDERDRRKLRVELLPAGMELTTATSAKLAVLEQAALAELDAAEFTAFNAIYEKLVTALETQFVKAGE